MADRPFTGTAARSRPEYVVRPARDRDEIRAMLSPHRVYAAYALGQLQPELFARSEWHISRGATGEALLLHSRAGLGNALFTYGDSEALEAALLIHPGPQHTFLTCLPEHQETVLRHFTVHQPSSMARLLVDRETFLPAEGEVQRLSGRDVIRINNLYRADGTTTFYTAENIDDAVYYGTFVEGRLLAVAGTHVISSDDGIGVVGNVFTHPLHRGQGLGRLVTSAVTSEVLKTCHEAVLSVDPANVAAVRAYERLGYKDVMRIIEGPAARRDAGPAAFMRRRWAAIRGRQYGGELVSI